ncbi:aldo/keto reductase [Pontixanthobacter aquaemixtae]|uniref:Aldo/keto reductase n=1 Tax=Pontixanthobacter aquaemixtae TaxID=1958940 RepID=A0A844ZXG4_9SPHN|nr:aldo/keto reductase [Pontixanthobacter aquaemixtae]MXO91880.1 aldo/keto reductase [Pontixanthobacter aquaemixtae]
MTSKRKLGNRMVHPVGLGCMSLSWAYGDKPPQEERQKLLNRAIDIGTDHLDTARIYGLGDNETLIGETLSDRREKFYLASKTGIIVEGKNRAIDCRPERITEQLEISLELLKTDHIDLYYMHRFDPKVPIAESVGALSRAVEAGKIGGYGVSEWSSAHIREAHAEHPVTAVQSEYSLWTRNPELGPLETCAELGIAFVAFSPVGRGALCGGLVPSELGERDFRRTMPRFLEEHWPTNDALIAQFCDLAAGAGMTAAQLSLAWVLAQGDHVHVIPGTTSIEHLEDNFASGDLTVDPALLEKVDQLINFETVSGHRYSPEGRASIDSEEFEGAA